MTIDIQTDQHTEEERALTPERLKELKEEGRLLRKEMQRRIKEMHTFTAADLHKPIGGQSKVMTNLSVYKGVLQIKQALKSMEIGVSFKATEDTKSPVAIFTMIKSDGVGIWFNKDLVSKDDEVKILARSKRNKQLLIYVKQYTYAVKDMQQPIKNWTLTQQIQKEHYALISLTQGSPTVSLLPKRATSLSEANELLMPKALKGVEGAIKQGAFFFVPVTKADYKAMASSYQKSHNMKFHRWELQNSLGTEHTPEQHFYTNDTEYVSCRVYRGKSSVFLEGWYKVVPDLSLKELLGD